MSGDNVSRLKAEAGGHRIQRIPENDRRGRVQSSTVTVAVLGSHGAAGSAFRQREADDFAVEWFSGTGCGGQHRNKHQNSARIIHRPTGLVRTAQTRSRESSRAAAMQALLEALEREADAAVHGNANVDRRKQVGSGERSDRRRLWAFQRDRVEDLLTGRSLTIRQAMRGELHRLW